MQTDLTIAILAGLGGMLGWGFADFFAKKTVDRIESIKGLVWAHLFGTLMFLVIAAVDILIKQRLPTLPTTAGIWLGLIFFGSLQMLIYFLVYEGFKKGQLAVLNPVFASFTGLVALGSVIFFHEQLTGLLVVALIIIFSGILLLNVDLESL